MSYSLSYLTFSQTVCFLWPNNKLPPIWWLKTIGIYSVTSPEAQSLKSVSLGPNQTVERAVFSPEALGQNPFFAFSALGAARIPWLVVVSVQPLRPPPLNLSLLHIHTAFSSVSLSNPPLLSRWDICDYL